MQKMLILGFWQKRRCRRKTRRQTRRPRLDFASIRKKVHCARTMWHRPDAVSPFVWRNLDHDCSEEGTTQAGRAHGQNPANWSTGPPRRRHDQPNANYKHKRTWHEHASENPHASTTRFSKSLNIFIEFHALACNFTYKICSWSSK